ncbi:hypothetical protein ALC60_09203, partial [Trachymyrmex zeteki]
KKKGWKKLCAEFDRNTHTSKWGLIKAFKKRDLDSSARTVNHNPDQFRDTFNKLCPPFCKEMGPPSLESMQEDNVSDIYSSLDAPLSLKEFNAALLNLKTQGAPSLDQFDPRFIKNLPLTQREYLLNLLNEIFKDGSFPLLEDLKSIGIPARVRRFICNLIFERNIYVVEDGKLKGPF